MISVNSDTLDPFADFPYLCRIFAYNNIDWTDLYQNLWKAQRRWALVGKVVSKTGAMVRAQSMLYKEAVQSVLLYGSESWVVTGEILKFLEVLKNQAAIIITEMTARRTTSEEWEWTPVAEALENSGIWTIKEYIQQRQETLVAKVACWPIYGLCTGLKRIMVTIRFMWWWEQDVGRELE